MKLNMYAAFQKSNNLSDKNKKYNCFLKTSNLKVYKYKYLQKHLNFLNSMSGLALKNSLLSKKHALNIANNYYLTLEIKTQWSSTRLVSY